MTLDRRAVLRGAATLGFASAVGLAAPRARAAGLGTLLDFAGGVPSPEAIRGAGAIGTIRYVSDPRTPGLRAKPLTRDQVQASKAAGLVVVSCYQWGKNETADWKGGQQAGLKHAQRGVTLHLAAGGPAGAPIYAAIDDNPSDAELQGPILGYLRGWQQVVGPNALGVYCNPRTIDFCLRSGVGKWFWQHDYGNPGYATHPAAHLHQRAASMQPQPVVDGIQCDVNDILKPSFGSW
ncbi:DUF1906 domain-containing protein [Segniliparus rugosus]|uniref:Rv2525c-like glycoside hydrolase-like domain-containing protein n=1 Tax=Segniliparus rugosus (strain ATCC BAA-974 / DSM 45345 / CCUG 50838 / CIP 108380 / JCM 13579 / CDC 945) TaxID=679197 RepID=U1N8Y8_SEGRC|nr:DUF1906 domain-containing protein [Segniliparus rugosus]ERG69283.1 hypothetical protein HMPREF9336_04174 [Segniliparus rugosus ATCC BAA-974]